MTRIKAVNTLKAEGETRELLEGIKAMLGRVPNLIKTMANSTSATNAYLDFTGALNEGELSAEFRERISLAVSEVSGCEYCVAAHTAIAGAKGITEEEILDSRRGEAKDPKVDAVLKFSRALVKTGGHVSDEHIALLREQGYTDGHMVEIIANVSINLFTNFLNHVACTQLDYPGAPELKDQ